MQRGKNIELKKMATQAGNWQNHEHGRRHACRSFDSARDSEDGTDAYQIIEK